MRGRKGERAALAALVVASAAALLAPCASLHAAAAADPTDDPPAAHAAPVELVETVEVEGRLGAGDAADEPREGEARVLEGDALRRDGAASLPEALARSAVLAAHDQVGNGRQLTLEVRGFAAAGATALVVDGVRLNEPDTNAAAFELLRLEDVERVEILPGPSGALHGGGALAGVVHVRQRRAPLEPSGEVSLRAGSRGRRELGAFGGGPAGPRLRLAASLARLREDGFRENAALEEDAGRVVLDADLGPVVLGADLSALDGTWRHPGALTREEIRRDPRDAGWNWLDFAQARHRLAAVRAESAPGTRVAWSATVASRHRESATLTSGRSCYGFRTDDSVQAWTAVGEALVPLAARRLGLRTGLDLARERLHPVGHATNGLEGVPGDGRCEGPVTALEALSRTDLDWDRGGAFARLEGEAGNGWRWAAGARHDRSRVRRAGVELGLSGRLEPVDGARAFAATTGSAEIARRWTAGGALVDARASWGGSFLAPSATQLFALPGFTSNPHLAPQRARGGSIGASVATRRLEAALDLFETRVEDEIAFDEAGAVNVNAGDSRRRGLDARLAWSPRERVRVSAAHVAVDAAFEGGWSGSTGARPGARVPLVPRSRSALHVELGPWRGVTASAGVRRTGSAPLSGDLDGSSAPLRARTEASLALAAAPEAWRGARLTLAIDNVTDEREPARGIESHERDPLGDPIPYFTPPAPRAITLGLDWRF